MTTQLTDADRARLDGATAALDPPFAVVDLDAFDANAADVLRRAAGKPVRLASKSLRCRSLQDRAIAVGFRGQLCFTLPEALWLAGHGAQDLVVAYPTADRAALRALSHGPHTDTITVMVDDVAQLDLIEAAARGGAPVRAAIDVDASWWPLNGRVRAQVNVKFLNAFNHPVFNNPGTDPTAADFAKVTSQNNLPRDIQIAAKIVF